MEAFDLFFVIGRFFLLLLFRSIISIFGQNLYLSIE